ncbi:MAG TPA: Panacea domain-containing protein [Pirellulales bacterium]|nr:Panacea domain-containing protein [Pirellulales bacterium]
MVKLDLSKIPDDEKMRELILYICSRSAGDQAFGATKLNKLLFYADFLAYRQFGRSMTRHVYQRLPNGPAPRAIMPILKGMEQTGEVAFGELSYHGKKQKRTYALRDANLAAFTADEIALVDAILCECAGVNATQISAMSHDFLGWQLAENGEEIPYEVSLVDFGQPSHDKIDSALAAKLRPIVKECLGNDR